MMSMRHLRENLIFSKNRNAVIKGVELNTTHYIYGQEEIMLDYRHRRVVVKVSKVGKVAKCDSKMNAVKTRIQRYCAN